MHLEKNKCEGICFFVLNLFVLLSPFFISAQILINKNLSVEDGLIYSQVLCAYQDNQGYMWFGTSSGISRWNGNSFKNFYSSDNIRFDNVKLITESVNNKFLFVTRNAILQYSRDKFKPVANLPAELESWIQYVVKSSGGNLLLVDEQSNIWEYNGNQFKKIIKGERFAGAVVLTLFQSEEKLFIGTEKNGIFYVQNDSVLTYLQGRIAPQNIITLFMTETNIMLIGTRNEGLFSFDGKKLNNLTQLGGLEPKSVNYIFNDDNDRLYISTDNGIVVLDKLKFYEKITFQNGLSNSFVWWISRDDQDNFYICTDGGGVDIYRPGIFKTYNQECGLADNTVWSVYETSDHYYYFCTDYGVSVLNSGKIKNLTTKDGLSEDMVITVFESTDGSLFFGTNVSGVDILKNGRFRNISTENGLTSNSVWTICEDRKGRVYLGTYDGGICVYQDGQITDTINTQDGLENDYVVSSYASNDGSVFFGLDNGGVYQVKNGKLNTDKVLLPGMTVWSIYQSKSGTFYLGTDKNGLIVFSETSIDTITMADGLSNNAILGIMEDSFERLYLTTDNGLNQITRLKDTLHIRIIGSEDGLASNECNQGAYFKDHHDQLWIGTIGGVTCYSPFADRPSGVSPKTYITAMKIFDKQIAVKSNKIQYKLAHNENYIQFSFIGLDFRAPHKIRYRYRLNGSQQDWINTTYPFVQFANLNDDEYQFEVQAANEWDQWGKAASLNFIILPPFWETWWFRILVILIAGGLAAFLIYYRVRQMLAVERIRAKIAADLHDDIGAGLSEINILSAVAEAKIPSDARHHAQNELSKISATAGMIIDKMSDIVWMVNPKKDSMTDIISRLKDIFNDVFDAKGISFISENSHALEKIKIDMERRQYIFLIFKEAINNAVKYSECDEVQFSVEAGRNNLKILMRDNGKGFDISNEKKGNGLVNMKNRAKKINGFVNIESSPATGTKIEFSCKI